MRSGAYRCGRDTVAVELRDTGSHDGRIRDQDVVNVLNIRDGEDVSSFDACFA